MSEKISKYYTYFIRGRYLFAENTPKSYSLALDEFLKALEIKECREIYRAIMNTYANLQDVDNSIKYAKKAFEFGDIEAMYFLGNIYCSNELNRVDFKAAFDCFQKCIDKEYARAYIAIARMYLNGQYVEKNEDKYLEYLKETLKFKNDNYVGEALEELGKYYYSKKDYKLAFEYFSESLKNGWFHSSFHLAICYRDGKGVSKDNEKYIEHLLKCYCNESYRELALLFSNNELVEPDNDIFGTSIYCLANTGDAFGAIVLAGIYANKVPYDEKAVNYWLNKGFSKITLGGGLNESQIKEFKACVDPHFHKTIDEMVDKYLTMRRYEA